MTNKLFIVILIHVATSDTKLLKQTLKKLLKKVVDKHFDSWYDIKVITATKFRPLKTEQSKTNQMCRAFLLCRNKPYLVNNIR